MRDIMIKSVAKNNKKKTRKEKPAPSKTPRIPAKINKESLDKLYVSVRSLGNLSEAASILGIVRTTVHSWRKKFPILDDTISHAMEDHKILTTSEHPEFFMQAMKNIGILLNDREIVEVTTTRERMISVPKDADMGMSEKEFAALEKELDEDKDFPSAKVIKEITKTRRYIREPSWVAIEKVLGKKELRHIVYSKIKNGSTVQGIALINSQFNNWILNDKLSKEWNGSLLNDVLDLLMIRALQAETRQLYDEGELPFETYSTIILNTTKNYGYIAHNRESRALKLLEGKSFAEILDTVKAQLQNWMNVVEAVCNDVSIDRKLIPSEIHKRIKTDKQVQGYTLWSDQGNLK